MIRSLLALAAIVAALSSSNAQAQSSITLGNAGYGGTGCPAGTASVTLAPDQQSLSILFDQYSVDVVGTSGRRGAFGRKACNITIPVNIPGGYSVSIFQVDYRGFVQLPPEANAQFDVNYFFSNSRGVSTSKPFYGGRHGLSDLYQLSDTIAAEAMVWSACGTSPNLRVNTSMFVQTNSRGDQAMATVDSADVSASLVYHLQWRRCR